MRRVSVIEVLRIGVFRIGVFCLALAPAVHAQDSFVNWENPHVAPLTRTPSGDKLLAVNTADNRLEVFDIAGGTIAHSLSIPVGLDPVSVRARTDTEVWVVNFISDSISIVDLATGNVTKTLKTLDEPADVVFAGEVGAERAFVSCSQPSIVLAYEVSDLDAPPTEIDIFGEEPRAMAVSNDGSTVYVAIFESGNLTTILGGGAGIVGDAFPPSATDDPAGPYGGTNPPPNDGLLFTPPQTATNPDPPQVGLIVRRSASGQWMDDNDGDWTDLVSGADAALSGRPAGWDLPDHDVAVIDAATLSVTYIDHLMNICMGIAVNPADGGVSVIGTEATNDTRFISNISGRFVRVTLAQVDPASPATPQINDLNPHLTYESANTDLVEREKSIGDPRSIVWNAAGTIAYVCGKGSDNVIAVDAAATRLGTAPTIDVGEGPTGLVLDEAAGLLYVMNHFDGSISVVDLVAELELERVYFHDPTPAAIKTGRKHLYSTHATSGLGQTACASCHVDARIDRISWDLGDPAGEVLSFDQNCIDLACDDWHPMKGPMLTQTLQDIIGNEPFHWRGDRDGIEEFNSAFPGLLGADEELTDDEMQEFEDFLATITYPPNPFRNLDNSLPVDLPLPGHYQTGRFGPAGEPLANGDAEVGLDLFRTGGLDLIECVTCHTLPSGMARDSTFSLFPFGFFPVPVGPDGEHHLGTTTLDSAQALTIKVPHLRNLYKRVGFEMTQGTNTSGFGFLHDGSVDSIARFVSEPVFSVASDQEVADLVAFMLAFSGSDLPSGSNANLLEPLGPSSQDTHAAVGVQITFDGTNASNLAALDLFADMRAFADDDVVGLVAKGIVLDEARGYYYQGNQIFQSDREDEDVTAQALLDGAGAGAEITFTVVPFGSQVRIGADRDEDGFFDRDELDFCSDPADPAIVPGPGVDCGSPPPPWKRGDCNADQSYDISDPIRLLVTIFSDGPDFSCDDACDADDDGSLALVDAIYLLSHIFQDGAAPPPPYTACGADATADTLECASFPTCD